VQHNTRVTVKQLVSCLFFSLGFWLALVTQKVLWTNGMRRDEEFMIINLKRANGKRWERE
jgi:hypothetical protein